MLILIEEFKRSILHLPLKSRKTVSSTFVMQDFTGQTVFCYTLRIRAGIQQSGCQKTKFFGPKSYRPLLIYLIIHPLYSNKLSWSST